MSRQQTLFDHATAAAAPLRDRMLLCIFGGAQFGKVEGHPNPAAAVRYSVLQAVKYAVETDQCCDVLIIDPIVLDASDDMLPAAKLDVVHNTMAWATHVGFGADNVHLCKNNGQLPAELAASVSFYFLVGDAREVDCKGFFDLYFASGGGVCFLNDIGGQDAGFFDGVANAAIANMESQITDFDNVSWSTAVSGGRYTFNAQPWRCVVPGDRVTTLFFLRRIVVANLVGWSTNNASTVIVLHRNKLYLNKRDSDVLEHIFAIKPPE